jgi:hypothetical protein
MLNGILIINSKNISISLNPDSKGNIKKKPDDPALEGD